MQNNKITNESITNVKKYFLYIFWFIFSERIFATIRTKKGFNNSIGWNLGKKNKSNHLLERFTSDPIKGTNNPSIPQRFLYPQVEVSTNANFPGVVDLFVKTPVNQ